MPETRYQLRIPESYGNRKSKPQFIRRNRILLRILGGSRWDIGFPSIQNRASRLFVVVVKDGVTPEDTGLSSGL